MFDIIAIERKKSLYTERIKKYILLHVDRQFSFLKQKKSESTFFTHIHTRATHLFVRFFSNKKKTAKNLLVDMLCNSNRSGFFHTLYII